MFQNNLFTLVLVLFGKFTCILKQVHLLLTPKSTSHSLIYHLFPSQCRLNCPYCQRGRGWRRGAGCPSQRARHSLSITLSLYRLLRPSHTLSQSSPLQDTIDTVPQMLLYCLRPLSVTFLQPCHCYLGFIVWMPWNICFYIYADQFFSYQHGELDLFLLGGMMLNSFCEIMKHTRM